MIRLDKYLCDTGIGTRTEVKQYIKKGLVFVNGTIAKKPELKIDELIDSVSYCNKPVAYQKFTYIMLNKPAGVVTATKDKREKTVLDLCQEAQAKNLSPVGRLDKDTEGLLILTNDGELVHDLLSPKKHVTKTYEVRPAHTLSQIDIKRLEDGLDIGDEEPTMPAHVDLSEDSNIYLSIREGRFHQVKRMFKAIHNEVMHLKRIRMGGVYLDTTLPAGAWRYLSAEEIASLKQETPDLSDIEAVIFDVDGTLVDSMGIWKEIDIAYLSRFQIPLPDQLQSEIEGMSFYQTACFFKNRFSNITDSIEDMMDAWNSMAWHKYLHEVPLKKGASDFLSFCREKGIKMGIATSNSKELIQGLEQSHHLSKFISCIKTGSEVTNGKPAPDIYIAAAEELGVSPENCLVFEDIVAGIKAGKAAGMKVCAIRDDYSCEQDLEKHELADYYIEDYYQILDRIPESKSLQAIQIKNGTNL